MSVGHRGQGLMGSENPANAPLTRVNPTTCEPVPTDVFALIPRFLTREEEMGIWPSHEQTSNHDDARLSIMEERVILHPEP